MAKTEPNIAPHDCREPRCDNLLEYTSVVRGVHVPHDRCASSRPMHPCCGWHTKNSL